MKICLAQSRAVTGNIEQNIERHRVFVETAVSHQANLIIFPELSLTGYEPTLAQALAIQSDDPLLDDFQALADTNQITIGVGMPTHNQPRPCISLVIFQPNQPRYTYSKQYLFPDEEVFFVRGPASTGLIDHSKNIALAICYEISVPQHAEDAFYNKAKMYMASVAKSVKGTQQAHKRLSKIAGQYGMMAFLSNCVGVADGVTCGGQSAVWNDRGLLLGQLDDSNEGLLIFDTDTQISLALSISVER